MKRFAAILLAGVAALLLIALGLGDRYLRSARPMAEGSVALVGLGDEVEVWRDSLGVPHVWAQSSHDLLFTQGYVHAQDRLWQMELFRRVAAGRLAEVMGAGLVSTDRFLRIIGLWRAAAAQEAALAPESRQQLEAYAAGVNAWLSTRRGALPPELLALRIEPEPWTVQHSLAIEKIMAWDLALYGGAVALSRVASSLDSATLRFFEEAYPDWGPTIVERIPEIPLAAAELLDAVSVTRASNAWVIGGSRTRSGKPILANDMHLALRAPSLWYLMALHGGGFDVAGMTLPGVPYVVAGHNRAIAWGYTNAMLDDVDFFVERLDPSDNTRYLTPAGTEAFTIVTESLRVKGQRDPVVFEVRWSRHGPILPDVRAGEGPVAMRWVAHDVSTSLEGVSGMNRAHGWEGFLAAVRLFNNPHQNVVYADTAGNFGYAMGGRVPRRGEDLPPPILPVPGWTGEWDWRGYLPFERHPQQLNPAAGYVVTANNRQIAGDGAALISSDWEPPFRAQRIREMILTGRDIDADAVHAMQLDVHDALAARYRTHAVAAAQAAGLDEAAATLESWDLRAAADSRGAALFYPWYDALRGQVQRSLFPDGEGRLPRKVLNLVLDSAHLPWIGDGGRATLDALTVLAAHTADSIAAGKTWGDLHHIVAEHALAQALDRILKLNVGAVRAGGSPTTVNVSHYAEGAYPVRAAYGASQRHVVDMADVDGTGGFILPTGQSGLPFDAHYRDQWPRWLNGGLWRIPLDRAAAARVTVHRLTLRPLEPGGYDPP
jgi:penicillin amidase